MALSSLPSHASQSRLWPRAGDSTLTKAWPYIGFLAVHLLTGLVFLINRSPGGLPGWGLLPIDDTWVTLVYARSFADSLTFTYNPGIAEAGMTSPLWVVILGILFRPLSAMGVSLPGLSQVLGILLGAGASAFAYLIVKHITGMRFAGVLVGLVIAIPGSVIHHFCPQIVRGRYLRSTAASNGPQPLRAGRAQGTAQSEWG